MTRRLSILPAILTLGALLLAATGAVAQNNGTASQSSGTASQSSGTAAQSTEQYSGRIILRLRSDATQLAEGSVQVLSPQLRETLSRWQSGELTPLLPPAGPTAALAKAGEEHPLADVYVFAPAPQFDIETVLRDVAAQGDVVYAEREVLYHLHAVPNDSAWSAQWGTQRIGTVAAWDVTRGSKAVPVGVIDTGLDYLHPDMEGQYWINAAEDANGDGRFQPWPVGETRAGVSGDFDGMDNDGNGFVDDVIGYDFVDQPGEGNAAGGDHDVPDPDPYDDMGHGTSVASIIAARADNGIGIAGVAPDCPVLILRAFDARGIGAESDVARALAYAVQNGVRVVNMSFGDVIYSRVLRDVIRWAYARNTVLIGSAGNSQSTALHYPSAYDETISVSATAQNDILAGFSNYGQTVDIAAPGLDIVTADREGRYGSFNGTSASTPFVSAVAALVLSVHPDFTPEEVRGVLIASAEDLGQQGWDERYGAGLLRADRAVALENPSFVRITAPRTDFATNGEEITVVGTAASPVMRGYRLQYGVGVNPTRWTDITSTVQRQAVAETLAVWNVRTLPDSTYTLRLMAESDRGVSLDDRVVLHIDRTAPIFRGAGIVPAIEGTAYGVGVGFITDDVTIGKVWYRELNSGQQWQWISAEGETENNLFAGTTHRVYMGPKYFRPGRRYEFYISAENAVGLESIARAEGGGNFELEIPTPVRTFGYNRKPYGLPLHRLFRKTADLNGNGLPELYGNNLEDDNAFSAWEFNGLNFTRVDGGAQGQEFPRGWGDLDGDGNAELLTSFVRNGFLYRGEANAFPSQRIWADTTDGDFWSVDIADPDGDGVQEAMAVIDDSTFGFFHWNGTQLVEEARIVNKTGVDRGPRNSYSAPRAAYGDFNANGKPEILVGDADGDFFIAEYNGSSWETIWYSENDYTLGSEFVEAGDFNNDGRDEIAVGFRTGGDDVIPFWYFAILRTGPDNATDVLWSMQFHGVTESAAYGSFTRIQNSLTAGNLDDDPEPELVITTFPELYVIDHRPGGGFEVAWQYPLVNTDAVSIADFDRNGIPELAVATPDSVIFFERNLPYGGPQPPREVTAVYESATSVRVTWVADAGEAPQYRLYRGSTPAAMELMGSFSGAVSVADPTLTAGDTFIYAVTAVDSTKEPAESPRVYSRMLHPHATPVISELTYSGEGQLTAVVSQDMGSVLPSVQRFLLNGQREPESVALIDPRTLLLSFGALEDGQYGLTLRGLRDEEGIPFEDRSYGPIDVQNAVLSECFIERVEYHPPRSFVVVFNQPVQLPGAEVAANYELQPAGFAQSAVLDSQDPTRVRIEMPEGTPIGALGKEYVLKVRNVLCASGAAFGDGPGSTAGVILNRQTLEDVFVYPNPLKPEHAQDFITFANLTPRATIRIYTLSGHFIAEVEETDGNGGVQWDTRSDQGELVPSGIYVYRAAGTNSDGVEVEAVLQKFAIIR
ncbi:S8 family serine peptidase [bacterium]|nr:S8 family serine peptidase [bacterium]